MLDIRHHGGIYGGAHLNLKGEKKNFVAMNDIEKGSFVGFPQLDIASLKTPTFTRKQHFTAFVSETHTMDYEFLGQLISDAGNSIMLRGNTHLNYKYWLIKPYTDSKNTLSCAVSKLPEISGRLYSVTKLDGNTFALFFSLSSADTTGVKMVVVRIDDSSGEPSILKTTNIFGTRFFKRFHYMPTNASKTQGVIFYATGGTSLGYSDSTYSYYAKMSIDSNYNLTLEQIDTTINYTSNEAFNSISNMMYHPDKQSLYFRNLNIVYKLDFTKSPMVLTQIKSHTWTGAEDYSLNFNTFTSQFFFRGANTFVQVNGNGGLSYTFDYVTGAMKKKDISNNSTLSNVFGVFGAEFDLVDYDYMTGKTSIQNPRYRKEMVYIGNHTFVSIVSTGSNPATALAPFAFYFGADYQSLRTVKMGGQIQSFNQYITGTRYIEIDKKLQAKVFCTSYWFYDGQGSFRGKYSGIIDLSLGIDDYGVSSMVESISGVALQSAKTGERVDCILARNNFDQMV